MSIPLHTEGKVSDLFDSHWRYFRRFLFMVNVIGGICEIGGVGGVLFITVHDV
ncbi:hypothetical protein DPMN_122367 [Dreissena polymorpha]|uniref:Uncharacterized protein n=1 Tax=Dreissena polymorpha TaxID=45954 RepID=A0A9D4GNF9_DREPO|nr:hypothetical protein DPMN_122367 [Dreissena polymorpha]